MNGRSFDFAKSFKPIVLILLLLIPRSSFAVPARAALETLRQPDGSMISVRQFGDERSNGLRTESGHTILQDEHSGYWVYAGETAFGGLRNSGLIVGRDPALGIRPLLAPEPKPSLSTSATQLYLAQQGANINVGSQPLLAIFVDFTPSVRVGSTAATLASKLFGATNSVRDYYTEVSYGGLDLVPAWETDFSLGGAINDGIVSVTLPYPHPNTGSIFDDRNRQIIRDALIAADPYIDYSLFDIDGDGTISASELHLLIIVAGYERSYSANVCGASLWGHHAALGGTVHAPTLDGKVVGQTYGQLGEWHCDSTNPPGHEATIGVMVHELGHDLGLPDLYDIDLSSEGVGDWSVMAGGVWNSLNLYGDSPAHFDPWSKFFVGWINPTRVTSTLVGESVAQSATNPDIYQLLDGSPASGEYFLIENRQRVGYDSALPGEGLLIWHIDASQFSNEEECYPGGPSCAISHYKVALVPADDQYDLERGANRGDGGDPWPGLSGKTYFYAASSPSSGLYSGNASAISVFAIGAPGAVMTVTLGVVGTTPIDTFITNQPPLLTNVTTAEFNFSATEPTASFTCRLDGAPFAACTSPASYGVLTAGSHTFEAAASVPPGDSDATPASYTWRVDASAPNTNITTGPTGTIPVNQVAFSWTGADDLTPAANLLYAYRLDPLESNFSAFGAATSASYMNLPNGGYTLIVKAKDEAGNEDPTPASRSFTVHVDSTAPSLAITSPTNGQLLTASQITVSGTASDAGRGDNGILSVMVNGVPANYGTAAGSGTANWSAVLALDVGVNVITVVAKDSCSNQNAATAQITVSYQPVGSLPVVSINDVSVVEGNSGTTNANFTVSLSVASSQTIAVTYSTANGSASAGSDYVASSGTLTFNPGETSKGITMSVNGDTAQEPNENFFVNLTSATNATIGRGQGTGTIVNDDIALRVISVRPTPSGFDLDFNMSIDPTPLNLYDTEAQKFGPSDLTIVGATTGPVKGSLVLDAAAGTMTFAKTGGVLAPDTYTLTLRSAVNGFKDLNGNLLDGDGNGVPGGDYVASFTVAPSGALVLSVPDFSFGPRQAVSVPFNRSGIPITLSEGGGVTSAEFRLHYDPALLTISAVTRGDSLPPAATLQSDLTVPGAAFVRILSTTGLGSGATELVRFTATVPINAIYGAAQVLALENVVLNQGLAIPSANDGVHLVAYLGDATGNRTYSALDAQRVLRVATGLDSGFAAYPSIDPVIVGDITGNKLISALDATRIMQEVVGLNPAEIAPIP